MDEFKACPICGCTAIYEIEREDTFIGTYPQLFCNGCKMKFEVENDSPYHKDDQTFEYLRNKLLKLWANRN